MSFLYNQGKKRANTAAALSHDSDDEIAAFDPFKSSSATSKNKRKGATTTVKADEDVTGKKAKKEVDEEDDEDGKREAKKFFDQLYQSSVTLSQPSDIIEVIDSPPLPESKSQTKNYQEISKKLQEIKQKAAKSAQSIPSAAVDVSPEPQPKIQVRKILTAKERQQAAEERAKTLNFSSALPKGSQQNAESEDDDDGHSIEIKVRLSTHEKKWKIKTSDPFSKVREYFCLLVSRIYLIPI